MTQPATPSPTVPKGSTKKSVHRAWNRLKGLYITSVVVIPIAVNLIASGISGQEMTCLSWIVVISTLMILVALFIGLAVWEQHHIPRRLPSDLDIQLMDDDTLQGITDVVTIAPGPSKISTGASGSDEWTGKPIGTFAKPAARAFMPNMDTIHAIIAAEDGWEEVRKELTEFGKTYGIEVMPIQCRPSRFTLDSSMIDTLSEELLLHSRNVHKLIVDITADAKPITITLFLAAQKAGLPITYLPQKDPNHPDFNGLYQIDPGNSDLSV